MLCTAACRYRYIYIYNFKKYTSMIRVQICYKHYMWVDVANISHLCHWRCRTPHKPVMRPYVQSDLLTEKRKPRGIRAQPSEPMDLTPLKLGKTWGETRRRTLGKIECSPSSVSLEWLKVARRTGRFLAMFFIVWDDASTTGFVSGYSNPTIAQLSSVHCRSVAFL